jgi:asparagine synthase (glutamine-hydrolysing)
MENYIFQLRAEIEKAVENSIGMNSIGILFSGGLDSSILAHCAKSHLKGSQITLYTVGTSDSHDILYSEPAADLLDLKSKTILIDSQDIASAVPKLSRILDSKHPVKLSYELPLFFGMAAIDEERILSGQGADELFGGYARYLNMNENELKIALKTDVETLINHEIKMDYKIAHHFKKDLQIPYLHDEVVKAACNIPVHYKVFNGERKIILKETALNLGLAPELANKQKKAVQYSCGIIKELRKMAKQRKLGVNDLIQDLL